eukprot:gene13815-19731_t
MSAERMLSLALPINVKLPKDHKNEYPTDQKNEHPFEQSQFDAIQFMNKMYPDESSLEDLDTFMTVLKKQVRSLDADMYRTVRANGGAHARAKQDVVSAQAQMSELFAKIQDHSWNLELFAKIQDIQRKSDESENVVQEICRDIKKLDVAKKHLTGSITALRRLAMLESAVSAAATSRDQYKKCANLLEAINQLMEYFEQYNTSPKAVTEQLKDAVIDDFKILLGKADVPLSAENVDRLSAACLVVHAMNPKVRDQLVDWVCEKESNTYQAIFSASSEAGKLDKFERRYLWFKSRLDEKRDQFGLFPENWRVAQTVCLEFCTITKAHLARILSEEDAELRKDIGPLVKAVVATNKFEKDMAVLFGGGAAAVDEGGPSLVEEVRRGMAGVIVV